MEGFRLTISESSASALGEVDHSGAGDISIVFGSFCEQRHVQDPVFVGQGKAGGPVGVQTAVNALPHRFVGFLAAADRCGHGACGAAHG